MSVRLDMSAAAAHLSQDDVRLIRRIFTRSLRRTRSSLAVDDVEVAVFIEPGSVHPFFGLVAYTRNRHQVDVGLDPQYPRWRDSEGEVRFSAVMAHEFYHVIRCRGPDRDHAMTLGARLVSEGLATNFEEETGHPSISTYNSLAEEYLRDLTERAIPLLDESPNPDGDFGAHTSKPFPASGVHNLGWAITKRFLGVRTLAPSAAVDLPAREILQWWLPSAPPPTPALPAKHPAARKAAGANFVT